MFPCLPSSSRSRPPWRCAGGEREGTSASVRVAGTAGDWLCLKPERTPWFAMAGRLWPLLSAVGLTACSEYGLKRVETFPAASSDEEFCFPFERLPTAAAQLYGDLYEGLPEEYPQQYNSCFAYYFSPTTDVLRANIVKVRVVGSAGSRFPVHDVFIYNEVMNHSTDFPGWLYSDRVAPTGGEGSWEASFEGADLGTLNWCDETGNSLGACADGDGATLGPTVEIEDPDVALADWSWYHGHQDEPRPVPSCDDYLDLSVCYTIRPDSSESGDSPPPSAPPDESEAAERRVRLGADKLGVGARADGFGSRASACDSGTGRFVLVPLDGTAAGRLGRVAARPIQVSGSGVLTSEAWLRRVHPVTQPSDIAIASEGDIRRGGVLIGAEAEFPPGTVSGNSRFLLVPGPVLPQVDLQWTCENSTPALAAGTERQPSDMPWTFRINDLGCMLNWNQRIAVWPIATLGKDYLRVELLGVPSSSRVVALNMDDGTFEYVDGSVSVSGAWTSLSDGRAELRLRSVEFGGAEVCSSQTIDFDAASRALAPQ